MAFGEPRWAWTRALARAWFNARGTPSALQAPPTLAAWGLTLYHRLARAAERELTSRCQRATLGQSLGTSNPRTFAKSIVAVSYSIDLVGRRGEGIRG